jgi:hypothetical protein
MNNTTDPKRNRPAEKGRNNDPNLRDEDARQQNLNTISSNDDADTDQHLTRTTSDSFREDEPGDKKADKRFDE